MDCNTNMWVEQTDENKEGWEVKVQSGELIEFSVGQRFALNGYWFEMVKAQNDNEIVLRGIEPTEKQKKRIEESYRLKAFTENSNRIIKELYNK